MLRRVLINPGQANRASQKDLSSVTLGVWSIIKGQAFLGVIE